MSDFNKIDEIDFWNNEYDLSVGIFVKDGITATASLSLSKKDKTMGVTKAEIRNALALGVIGMANQENVRYEHVLQDILDRCREIEREQNVNN